MRQIKFRQPIFRKGSFVQWHYWGFLSKGLFVAPSDDSVNWEKSQQFTGLLDKNGKEIWEGDIVLTPGKFKLEVKIDNIGYGDPKFFNIGFDVCEVIGNIYERGDP